MLSSIKQWLFNRKLKSQLKNKSASSLPSGPIQKVAILFDATAPNELQHAREFIHQLKKSKLEYRALAFVESIEDAIHIACPIFSPKQINKLNIPTSLDVISFINYDADVLILLNPDQIAYKNYILALSNAKLKAGITNKDAFDHYYTFMLDVNRERIFDRNLFKEIFNTMSKMMQHAY